MQKIVPYRGDIEGCAMYWAIVSTDVQPHCANSQSLPELHNVNMLTDSELYCMMTAVAASRKKGKKKKAHRRVENGPNSGLLIGRSSPTKNYSMN